MSLDFNIKNIKNYKTLCYQGDQLSPITNAIIWSTMGIGIGEITDKNHEEFYERMELQQKVYGPFLSAESGPFPITLDMVRDHIGLKTNVFPKVTKKKFMANLAQGALEKVLRG